MKICLSWLKEFVTVDEPPSRLAADLSMLGLPVDAVTDAGPETVLELDITANRPDCLNHLGVARELATLYREPLRPPRAVVEATGIPAPSIEIADPDLCARYSGLVIAGVRVGPSPAWLQERLQHAGQRSINNIVDITNYVLLELGHPLHAFDFRRLNGSRIVVRRARGGEAIRTLDDRIRELEPDMLVIADAREAVAVAGVMGGAFSEVDDATTDILLESAWFLPASIRRTSRRLGLSTEASYRFERGADLQVTTFALRRAARLILELAGGDGVSPVTDVYPRPWEPPVIRLRASQARRLIGVAIGAAFVDDVLGRLGCEAAPADGGWDVRPPSHRPDLAIEADLIEELARFHGYNRLPSTLPLVDGRPVERRLSREKQATRRFFQETGFQEIITTSFTGADKDDQFIFPDGGERLKLDNPLDEAEPYLRRGLLGGLVTALKLNENDYNAEAQLFELSSVYRRSGSAIREPVMLTFGGYGSWQTSHWSGEAVPFGFYQLKGVLAELARRLGVEDLTLEADDSIPFLQPGTAAVIRRGRQTVGCLGQLNDLVARQWKFKRPVLLAECDFEALAAGETKPWSFKPLPRFPFVDRDVSFLVDNTVAFSTIETTIAEVQIPELDQLSLVDLYRGKDIPPGRQSMTIRLVFQHPERTLTDAEADALRDRVVAALTRKHHVQQR
jgi:phenylalanyl-tRNA synthetase beta chain